ncbi:MAG: rhomboid family intramembrane serine protease [Defluviitaleaceae bacterium]|nr:rhomboid family intramembrane serine protease [Defluviitaleaceae bacterium]
MFAQFSALLYSLAKNEDYQLPVSDGETISDATYWIAQKSEMATVLSLYVFNAEKTNMQMLLEYEKNIRSDWESNAHNFGHLVGVFVIAGGDASMFDGVEFDEYYGQQIHISFWHINLETGEITVPKGQPKKLFNLREMISNAYKEMSNTTEETTFTEIKSRVEIPRSVAKHRWPIISIAVILINALILGFMYLEGYNENNIMVPVRFGALVSENVIYKGEWHRLFNAMFLHFNFGHFFSNAFGILIFGTRLERYLGRRMFCSVYIFSGLLGSVFTLIHSYYFQPHAISAGASGAVYGIVGAVFIYTRITKRSIEGIGWYIMLIYIGLGFVIGFATPGIGNFAHLGGLIGGILIGGVYAMACKK